MKKDELILLMKEEGDEHEWKYIGFNCHIKRSQSGYWCGYVVVPTECLDFLQSDSLDKIFNDNKIMTHGGITFNELSDDGYWIGFDCSHSGDLIPNFALNFEMQISGIYRNKKYVIDVCESMVRQIYKIPQMLSYNRDLKISKIL